MPGIAYRSAKRRASRAAVGKDFWDKVSTLTVPFVTLVVGLLGAYATYSYNQAALNQQATQAQSEREQRGAEATADRRQRQAQAESARLIADAEQLQKLFVYVASPDAQKREFGYWMFDALGRRDLAVRLIALKQDKAGIQLLRRSQTDPRPEVRAAATKALQALLTPEQRTAVGALIERFEGSANPATVRRTGGDVSFGSGGWRVADGGLRTVVARYCQDGAAAVRELCAPGRPLTLPIDDRQFAWLQRAARDPAMHRAEIATSRAELSTTTGAAEEIARSNGVRLPLSVAIVSDTVRWMGSATARRMADEANARSGGSPAQGKPEIAWATAYMALRRQRVDGLRSRMPDGMIRSMQARNAFYDGLVADGEWQMKTVRDPTPERPKE